MRQNEESMQDALIASQVDPNLVTPGPWGFAIIALVAVAAILLVWDMMRRIRRGRVRADIREELEAEQQADAEDRQQDEEQDGTPDQP